MCLTIPFDLHTTQMKVTVTLDEVLPRGSTSRAGLDQLTSVFGWGQAFPTQLIMVPPVGTSAYSATAFQGFANIIAALSTAPGITQFNVSTDLETAAFSRVGNIASCHL